MLFVLLMACTGLEDAETSTLPATGCSLETAEDSVSFGELVLSEVDAGEERRLDLENTGDEDCAVSAVMTGPAPFSLSGPDQLSLAPGERGELQLLYAPSEAGNHEGLLLLEVSDRARPSRSVQVSGTALAPGLGLSGTLTFDGSAIGCEDTTLLELSNLGDADLEIWELRFEHGGEFHLDQRTEENGALPWVLPPGESLTLQVAYVPRDAGIDQAHLSVFHNASTQPQQVTFVGNPDSGQLVNERFEVAEHGAVDVLISMDRSCSMADVNAELVASFSSLLSGLEEEADDYHVGVVAMQDGCLVGSPLFADNSMTRAEQQELLEEQACLDGSCGPYIVHGERAFSELQAVLSAANTGAGGCNEGFLRDEARLLLLGVSDEPEQSVDPYSTYVSWFQGLKSDPSQVMFSAIGGDDPSGCGSAMAYVGFYSAVVETGGDYHSICAPPFDLAMESIGQGAVPVQDSFPLSEEPVPSSLEVQVDGVLQSAGWSYAEVDNAVVFEASTVPARGSVVEVAYAQASECGP